MSTPTERALEATTSTTPGPQRNGTFGTKLPIIAGVLTALAEAINQAAETGVGIRELAPMLLMVTLVAIGKHYQEGKRIINGGTFVVTAPSADPNVPDYGEAPAEPVM